MKNLVRKQPLFVILLPVFFILHGLVAHAGFISLNSIWPLLLSMLAGAGILYFISRIILKQPVKAGLFTLYCLGFYFFFGALYDFLKVWSPWTFLWKYSVLLAGFTLFAILLFVLLFRTKKDLSRTALFFNLLFLLFIVFDLVKLSGHYLGAGKNPSAASGKMIIPSKIHKPDIYLLLFDEYSSTQSLKKMYRFDNSALDSFLVQQGFHLISGSRSNYHETMFSMASCLNMDYLHWVEPGMYLRREHFQRCASEIRNNEVVQLLSDNGYQIVNQSIFHLKHHPAPVSQRWLNVDTRLITEETLMGRLCYEFNWFFERYALFRKILPVTSYQEQMQNNDRCLEAVLNTSAKQHSSPRFIYGHFMLPHYPFYRDRNGKIAPDSVVNGVQQNRLDPLPKYLEYVQYANIEIKKLIAGIRANDPQAVILFMSDHGYRWNVMAAEISNVFYNQNAIYLPSGKYGQFYDSITNVNQFRTLFNTLFEQHYKLLPDNCVRTALPGIYKPVPKYEDTPASK
ncbi:sulfatase-like hydrolase/transferase [Pseudobacter ginsenosidimutans]|uniref:Sulfatase-like protein n=1 Tax=Pseudobacter ginsenosidimutans TaxID=661488 RepID=A0A4Q7MDM3_9BACT|nr:sulfatase-like hydrolase/transferase [Pseudobacter ginsenosidimutans]QEC42774.1 LTA synthase family protein [Pseudobacter ginsenosidimutans]RZS65068.1 sulfatase-like protein [Pseudobacter ginsenosidimutans]